jgi:N-acetylglucosaminyldiphosphoundecaprenol N-acetyl-beta-D-mannosaminyltransferase
MKRVEVLGVPLDAVRMDEAVGRCEQAIAAGGYLQHMSVNVAKLVTLQSDTALRDAVSACDLVTADGQGVVWASRLLGRPLPERVAGIDLMTRLLERADERGYRVYVLGARREVLDAALARLRDRHPRLTFAGARDGYFADAESEDVCEEIRASRADMLFVAMSSPRKELFLDRYGPSLGVPFAMGVGGSVDVIAGVTRRAPRLVQRTGLEWLYRLAQEPRRLGRRYLVTNVRFAGMVARERLRRRRRA